MTANSDADLQAFIDRAQPHLIDVQAEGKTLKLVPRNHPAQVAGRIAAKAALDALRPYWERRADEPPFDALTWLKEHEDAITHALDYIEVFGRPVAYDERIGHEPDEE